MINFMKYKYIYFILSGVLLIVSIASLALWRLRPSIDFTGGSLLEIQLSNNSQTKDSLSKFFTDQSVDVSSIQPSGANTWLIRTKEIDENKKNEVIKNLTDQSKATVTELRFESVGPSVGKEVTRKTIIAVVLAVLCILLYVAWISRKTESKVSSWKFGVCAVLALMHDSIITVGIFSLLGHFLKVEVDLLFVTAVLTVMSFSVHDTIVVFDRIKESFRKQPRLDLLSAVNISLTETMGRSLNNSLTIIFMLFTLALLGGQTIFYFVLALLIGTILGTYSSPFVATPLLVVWEGLKKAPVSKKK